MSKVNLKDFLAQKDLDESDVEFLGDIDIQDLTSNLKIKIALKKLRKKLKSGEGESNPKSFKKEVEESVNDNTKDQENKKKPVILSKIEKSSPISPNNTSEKELPRKASSKSPPLKPNRQTTKQSPEKIAPRIETFSPNLNREKKQNSVQGKPPPLPSEKKPPQLPPMKNVTPERVVKEEEDDDSDGGSFPTIDPYELVKDKRHKSVSVALTDELTGKAEYTTVPVYRLCPYCEFLCPRATDGCKHTKCSNPSCGNWFCHVCLRVPPQPIDLSQCYVRRDNSIVRWGCGEGQLKAYTICPVRNRRMVYPTQTRDNKNDWKVRSLGKQNSSRENKEKMRREAEIKRKRIEKLRKEQQEHEQQMKDALKSYQKEQKKGSGGGLLGKIGNVLGDVADAFLPGSGPNPNPGRNQSPFSSRKCPDPDCGNIVSKPLHITERNIHILTRLILKSVV